MTQKKKTVINKVDKIWLSVQEAANYIGMSKTYISDLRKKGILPHCMIGNAVFFLKADIDNMMEKHRVYKKLKNMKKSNK